MFKFIVASLITVNLLTSPAAFAEDQKIFRQLSLSGHGEVKAVPDMAVVSLGTLSQATTAKAALEANSKSVSALLVMLKDAGVSDNDVMTDNFNVAPRYDNGSAKTGQPPKLIGYDVTNSVVVSVRKIADLGTILDKAVSSGTNQIDGISFTVADPQTQQEEARKAAVKDALHKADIMTQAAGVKLGPIMTMNENGAMQPTPMVMMGNRVRMAEAAPPVPVAPGEMTIAADVNVVWQLE